MRFRRATVLHLSHGSIRDDSRVCKVSVATAEGLVGEVCVMGVRSREGEAASGRHEPKEIDEIKLWSGVFRGLAPRLAAYFGLVEMTVRMALSGICVRPSIVHCHDYVVLPAAWMASTLVGSMVVYDAHELESKRNGMSQRASRLCLFIERCCWRRISLLVSVSPPILDWYAANLGPKRSVLVLNSPVLPSPDDTAGVRRSFGQQGYFHRLFKIPVGTPVFIYLGYRMPGRESSPCCGHSAEMAYARTLCLWEVETRLVSGSMRHAVRRFIFIRRCLTIRSFSSCERRTVVSVLSRTSH